MDGKDDRPPTPAEVLQLFAEEANVSRRTIETGRVRVSTITQTRDPVIDEALARTQFEVERIPLGRVIDAVPAVKQDADLTIVPIVEETVVVERKLAQVTRIAAENVADTDALAGSIPQRKPEDA